MSEDVITPRNPRPVPKVESVEAGPGRVLTVHWRGGGSITVDLAGWIGFHRIERLYADALFRRPEVGEYGSCVQWDGDEDLAIDTIHLELLAGQQAPFAGPDLALWQDHHALSNQEAADLLGVSMNTFLHYRTGTTRIPRGVAIACRAIDRDPLIFTAHYRPRRPGRPAVAAE
jgi:hypothetical protein